MNTISAALLLAALSASPQPGTSIRRFGLFVGSNDGGPSRVRLQYAASDARGLAQVLERLGGMAPDDTALLLDATRAQISAQLERFRQGAIRARATGARTELVFYYSGHADETGLLLGRERMAYQELRAAIDALPLDVRVAILDSCYAGSFVRLKGGKRVAPFLVDASSAVRGYAFLTSSSANEAAQESDRIRSSYFTFALLSGLRGAADTSGDGKVTLTEAYQFAFQETLAKTERSMAGPQHPAYDIHLAGTGDLVMTDLRAQTAGLVISPDLSGRFYVRDDSGRLVVELRHAPGKALELGLEPGTYGIRLDTGSAQLATRAVLAEGKRVTLRRADFGAAPAGEPVATRGDAPMRSVPFNFSLWHPVSIVGEGEPAEVALSLNFFYGRIAELRGFELGLGVNQETWDMTGAQVGMVNVVGGEVRGVQYGLASWASGDAVGYQAGLLSNTGGRFSGYQEGWVASLAGGDLEGLQLAGVFAYTAGEVRGVQLSPVTIASSLQGAQVGVVNVVDRAAPVQVGVVNVAGSAGVPVGVVNVADHADAPIGLVNWVKDGYRSVGIWASDVAPTNVGVKLGGRYVYTLLAAGLGRSSSLDRYLATFGLGLHLPIGGWSLDVDASISSLATQKSIQEHLTHTTLRAMAIVPLWRGLALQAGPTWNVTVGTDGADVNLAVLPQTVDRRGATTVRQFPGFALGLQMQTGG